MVTDGEIKLINVYMLANENMIKLLYLSYLFAKKLQHFPLYSDIIKQTFNNIVHYH